MKKVYWSAARSAAATFTSVKPIFFTNWRAASLAFSDSGTGSVNDSCTTPSSRRSP